MSRSRNWCFTMNNYSANPLAKYSLDTIKCRFMRYGKEVGESGTPHLQGLVIFDDAKSFEAACANLVGCHVEKMLSLAGSMIYTSKDGDVTDRGILPTLPVDKGASEQVRWLQIRVAAEAGEFSEIPEKIRFNQKRLLEDHRDTALRSRTLADTTVQHLWYWGKPGTGKSRKAREDHPDAFLKSCNKWWCGYTDHPVVLIEDFDKRHEVLAHHLKIWGDRYPFPAEVKGGSMKIRPNLIIITSNYSPKDIWTDTQDLDAILRRFKTIEFKELS